MDSSGKKTPCKNSTYGCTFASSSAVDMVKHFQCDCTFHPVRCFECSNMVRKVDFAKHYVESCQRSSAMPSQAPEEAPAGGEAKTDATVFQEQHFLQECVRECTLRVESLSRVVSDVAADVVEVKGTKEKLQDLEATVKGQGDAIQELGKGITTVVETVNKVQEDVSGLVNRLEKDAETRMRRIEKVSGLLKDVSDIKRAIEDRSKIHWYVENISQYVKEADPLTSVKSKVFVTCGYSARLLFQVYKVVDCPYIALYFRLCPGPNDSLLQWPFRIPYTVSLIHPNDASKTKEHKTTPPSCCPECFEKPQDKENETIGINLLCTVKEAQDEGFLENDALCFALTLHK